MFVIYGVFMGHTHKSPCFCVFSLRAPFDEFIKSINYSLIHKKQEQATSPLSTSSALSGAGDNAEARKVFTVNKLVEINRQ